MTYKLTHKHTRVSSAAHGKVCMNCKTVRGTILSLYDVDDKPKVFAFCTKACATTFRKKNK